MISSAALSSAAAAPLGDYLLVPVELAFQLMLLAAVLPGEGDGEGEQGSGNLAASAPED